MIFLRMFQSITKKRSRSSFFVCLDELLQLIHCLESEVLLFQTNRSRNLYHNKRENNDVVII